MRITDVAKALGRLGGRARAKKLSAERKKKIAAMGGRSRALSRHAARRIERNFYGWQAVRTLRKPPKARSVSTAKEPLPGIYAQDRRLS